MCPLLCASLQAHFAHRSPSCALAAHALSRALCSRRTSGPSASPHVTICWIPRASPPSWPERGERTRKKRIPFSEWKLWNHLKNACPSFSSVPFSRSAVPDSSRPHELQHARPPCPSPTPGVHSKLTSIESVMRSSHLILSSPSPPAPNPSQHQSFPMSQLFA